MTNSAKTNITCPTCDKPNTWQDNNAFRPFCSKRCKLIDLGEWASEGRSIPGEQQAPQDDDSSENGI